MQQWFHIAGHWQAPINFHRVLDAFKISSNKGHDNHGRRLVKNIGCTGKLKYCGPKVHGKSDKCMGICHRPIRWHNLSLNKPFVKALSHLRIVDLCIIFNGVTEKLFQSQTIRVGLYPVFCAKPLTCPLRLQRTSSTELVTKLWTAIYACTASWVGMRPVALYWLMHCRCMAFRLLMACVSSLHFDACTSKLL